MFLECGLCILMWERKRWPPQQRGLLPALAARRAQQGHGAVRAGVTGHGEASPLAVRVSWPKAGETDRQEREENVLLRSVVILIPVMTENMIV